jgi:diacylglycerol kinase
MRTIHSFRYAWNGLKTVWREEANFKIEIFSAVIILAVIFYLHFSVLEIFMCLVAIASVLGGEVVNTAIEDVCNKIEPNQDEMIGKIKDTMAGYVFFTSLFALVCGVLAFYSHFFM